MFDTFPKGTLQNAATLRVVEIVRFARTAGLKACAALASATHGVVQTFRFAAGRKAWLVAIMAFLLLPGLHAQQAQRGRGNQAPGAARGNVRTDAPFDPTGYFVSLVSDEWRYRMITPPKGNVDFVPINAEGRRVAGEWDAAKDEAAGDACKGYGAGGIMRLPGRLHITWRDPNTLSVEIDNGTQTRLLHFGESQTPANEPPSWQGYSVAQWELAGGRGAQGQPRNGQLKVVTTKMKPGYLRKNGVPYSANAVLTEYFALLTDDDGSRYLAVTTMLDDPTYLLQPWVRTSQFKKQADGKGWNPTPCSAS